jgi:threonine dehydratase
MSVTLADIKTAAERIKGIAVRTPLICNDALDAATGARVFVKAECLQRGGAFKIRGAANAIAALDPVVRQRGVLAFSSGNHAIAVATASKIFGIQAVIVMPSDAPRIKREMTERLGAEVIAFDRVKDDREAMGARISQERGLSLIKPFDDPNVIAGQGTAGLEIGEEIVPDLIFVPASGGGLACGVALALPNAAVYGVEPEGHDDIHRSLASGRIESNSSGIRSICDGLLVERAGEITFPIMQMRFAGSLVLSDEAARRAMKFAFQHLKLVLEPSGAIALAAALEGGVDLKAKIVAVLASGGNVDPEQFAKAIA